jgi:hypothetical protein
VIKKMKSFLKSAKVRVGLLAAAAVTLVAGVAGAEPPAPATVATLGAALADALETAVADTLLIFASLLPIALTIFAAIYAIKFGMRIFKSVAKG